MVRILQDAVRKQRDIKTLSRAVANVTARAFAVAGHFWQLPLTEAMCLKYPAGGCGYCSASPCICLPHERQSHVEIAPSESQLGWNLRDHQEHLRALYGVSNVKAGIENALTRLFAEIAEISELQTGITMIGSSAKDIEMEYAKEISDVFAWIIAVAVILGIDVEESVLEMYGRGCPSCSSNPCICPKLVIDRGAIRHQIESYPGSVAVKAQ